MKTLHCFGNIFINPDFMNEEAKAKQISMTHVKFQGDSMTQCRSVINVIFV